jgi:Mrp family chromosome partitioning ATPase
MEDYFNDPVLRENMGRIKNKVMVISGKGGVGKSTVAANLAIGLYITNRKTGILDVDLHGPSMAKMLGSEGHKLYGNEHGKIIPVSIKGVKAISLASVLESPDSPTIWRGPMKTSVIRQFLRDVEWGKLDCLVIDSPPGTGDEPLSVCQLIPEIRGTIIVTTPQDMSLIDARRAIRFSQMLNIPVLGIVENMSGFKCPHCRKDIDLFKRGGGERMADEMGIPLLGKIPFSEEVVKDGDKGIPAVFQPEKSLAAREMMNIAGRLNRILFGDRS